MMINKLEEEYNYLGKKIYLRGKILFLKNQKKTAMPPINN